jgi:Bacteriocin-protection, YdeI or OmpD-Associated
MLEKTPPKLPHEITKDISKILNENPKILKTWNTLTPLAQNEWICWITFFKKQETYQKHLVRLKEDLIKGKRRPCCWSGCPHRIDRPKKIYTAKSKSQKIKQNINFSQKSVKIF